MRPRVAGMVWLPKYEADPSLLEHLRRKLTVVPRKVGNYGDETVKPEPIRCYSETPMEFGVPRAYWFDNAKKRYDYQWDVSYGSETYRDAPLESRLTHTGRYAEQADIIKVFLNRFTAQSQDGSHLGGILHASTGFGKSDVALGIANAVGVSTLILTHKEFLLKQWVARIKKWMPDAKVGIVREEKCEFEGCDFVVAMMQSLALDTETRNRYPAGLYDWAGFLILDEIHRVGAPTWAPLAPKFSAAHRLGLTATPRRKDDADVVFWWNIGQIAYRAKTEMPKPHVRMIFLPKAPDAPDVLTTPDKNNAVVINVLTKMSGRNVRIIRETVKALKASSARKIMVLSERLEHLRKLEASLQEAISRDSAFEGEQVTTDFYVGEWFTGDVVQPLRSGSWTMENGGREEAINLIYTSVSRRKGYRGTIERQTRDVEKIHVLHIPASDMAQLFGEDFGADGSHSIILEDCTDEELFGAAKWWKVQQKRREKMRPRTDEELLKAEQARVMFGTYQLMAEGIDLPPLDLLVLASPISDIEQTAGRSRRFCDPEPEKCNHFCPWRAGQCLGKPHPIIVDFVDLGYPLTSKRERYREGFYESLGCKIAKGKAS